MLSNSLFKVNNYIIMKVNFLGVNKNFSNVSCHLFRNGVSMSHVVLCFLFKFLASIPFHLNLLSFPFLGFLTSIVLLELSDHSHMFMA